MMRLKLVRYLSTSVILGMSSAALGDACPPPPSAIDPSVRSSVSFDASKKLYIYRYSVSNGARSPLPIDYFGVLLSQASISTGAPNKWMGAYMGSTPATLPVVRWTTIAVDPIPPNSPLWNSNNPELPTPSYAIKPGKTLDGFSFQSPQPPGIGQYFVQGFTQDPIPSESGDDAPINCPGWNLGASTFSSMVTGLTVAPANPNLISVKVRLRDESGLQLCRPINPKRPKEKIGIVILSSEEFDASSVDVSTVKFGPGFTSPISSKLFSDSPDKDSDLIAGGDREEWENKLGLLKDNKSEKKGKSKLLLVFDPKILGIRCGIDHALFLSGKTKDGKNFAGGVAIKSHLEGCEK